MNVHFPAINAGSDPWGIMMVPLGLMLVYQIVLFGFLYRVLTRSDFDVLHKILWVLVVILAPFLGFVLYVVTVPRLTDSAGARVIPGSDVSGTRWAKNPGYTKGA